MVIPLASATAPRHKADQRKFRLSVSVIAFLIAYSVVATFGSAYVLQDQDTFWHIRTGEWILENATVPTIDTFSHTAYGQPWIANDWLADVIFATAFKVGHWRGVVEITAMAIGVVAALICLYLTRILRFSVAIGLTTITALLISPHYLARPIIFAYAIMAIWVIILLDRYDRDESERFPLVLIPLMVLWANISGSFTIGLVFLYTFAAYACYRLLIRRQYAWLRWELLMVLAVTCSSLITPYGIHSMLITPKAMSMRFALQNLIEWHSPNFQEHRLHLLYLIGIFSVFAAFGVRLRGARLPIFMLLMYLGLSYLRGLVMFVLLTPLVVARAVAARAWYLRAQLSDKTESADPVLHFLHKHIVAIPAACLVAALVVTVANWNLTTVRPPDSAAPQAAIDYAKRASIGGNVFNSYDFGGYLIFSGIPTAIDGRAQPFGDAFMRRYFNALDGKNIADTFRMLDEYDIDWAILRPAEGLSRALGQSAMWEKVYSDDHAVVFVRRSARPSPAKRS
jgi:hypothetical protein